MMTTTASGSGKALTGDQRPSIDELRKQVAAQCRAVAHLATALAQVNSDYARMLKIPSSADELLEIVGKRTARHMEKLGDILNGMDAVTEDDEWLNPIFKEAQRLWPTASESPRSPVASKPSDAGELVP